MVQAYLQRWYLAERVILPDIFRFLVLALRKVNPDELKRDLLFDQDKSGAASSTGRVGSVEFNDHDQEPRVELGKRLKGRPEDPIVGSANDHLNDS